MYTILVTEDHSLIATNRERIMQRSKNVNSLCFLIKPQLNEINIENSAVLFEYVTPVSHRYDSIVLANTGTQGEHLMYELPFDLTLTAEAGELEVQLTFLYIDLDADGNPIEQAKKTKVHKIKIVPIASWSDYIPDSGLTSVDQRILKTEAQLKAMQDMMDAEAITAANKADDITYNRDENTIQLVSGDKPIGTLVKLKECEAADLEEGLPIVDFSNLSVEDPDEPGSGSGEGNKDDSDVVEF